MSQHLLVLPFILPLLLGATLGWISCKRINLQRGLSLAGSLALLVIASFLVQLAATDVIQVYNLGNWQAPFGITLVLDRLSALMLITTAVLAVFVNLYAMTGDDSKGKHFYALFQFQLAGINGAFLTGDLFNLFVCFEILLIASYALLLHGQTVQRISASIHYLVLNLLGSSIFLLGLGVLYGVAGTLNMADLANKLALATGNQRYLLQAAGWILTLVFGLKAAFLPLHFWLPRAYSSASAPAAALFAIMTKVGLYAILRLHSQVFGADTGAAVNLGSEVLFVIALLTLILGALGTFASASLHKMLAYLVLMSVGTILTGFSLGSVATLTASLYYLVQSTWGIAGLFLLAQLIGNQRGVINTNFKLGPPLLTPNRLGLLFFIGAIATAGLPPFAGFIGKLSLLQAVSGSVALALWLVVLICSFIVVLALSRAGSQLFWLARARNIRGNSASQPPVSQPPTNLAYFSAGALISSSLILVMFAQPVLNFTQAAAEQITSQHNYLQPPSLSAPVKVIQFEGGKNE